MRERERESGRRGWVAAESDAIDGLTIKCSRSFQTQNWDVKEWRRRVMRRLKKKGKWHWLMYRLLLLLQGQPASTDTRKYY